MRKGRPRRRRTEKKAAGGSLLLRFSPAIVVRRSKVTSRRRRRRGKLRPRDNEKRMGMRMRETERTESDWRSEYSYVRTLCCPEDGGGKSGFLFCASFGTWPYYSLIQFSLSISRSLPLSPSSFPLSDDDPIQNAGHRKLSYHPTVHCLAN